MILSREKTDDWNGDNRISRRNKKWNSLAVLGILALLGLGFAIPAAVMAVEDYSLNRQSKIVQLEDISLDFQQVNLKKELQLMPDLLSNMIIVEKGEEEENGSVNYEKYKIIAEEFLQNIYREEKVEFQTFFVSFFAVTKDSSAEQVHPFWVCCGLDEKKQSYYFWVDEITGMVMAFDVPAEVTQQKQSVFEESMKVLGSYYGFELTELTYMDEEEYAQKYWECEIFLGEADESHITLYAYKTMERFSFNMYPGTMNGYGYVWAKQQAT